MKFRPRTWIFWGACLAATSVSEAAEYAPAPEDREVLRISRALQPIPDERWREIAGTRIQENYSIIKGDTLYDISNRLFGDPRYWPKIWALNNKSITNPHLIRPGTTIAFLPGTGSSLPEVLLQTAPLAAEVPEDPTGEKPTEIAEADIPPPVYLDEAEAEEEDESEPASQIVIRAEEYGQPVRADFAKEKTSALAKKRSREWRKLPRQTWEEVRMRRGQGELSTVQKVFRGNGVIRFEMPAFATSQPIDFLGTITGSNEVRSNLILGDLVAIEAEPGSLQIGEIYSVSGDPTEFLTPADEAMGFAYPLYGKVKIQSFDEERGVFLARITYSPVPFNRGMKVVPAIPAVGLLTPTPGPAPLEATVYVEHRDNTYMVSLGKQIFLNRGVADGVTPGMVFQVFAYADLNTNRPVTSQNILLQAEAMVIQVSDHFSTAVVTQSALPISEGSTAKLLTRPEDLSHVPSVQQEDELDKLDNGKGLGPDEERELKQLEEWKGNPQPVPSPAPSEAPPPPAPTPEPTPEMLPDPQPTLGPGDELPPPGDASALPPPPPGDAPPLGEFLPAPPTAPAPTPASPTTSVPSAGPELPQSSGESQGLDNLLGQ